MTRLIGLMAAAVGFTTTACSGSDGTAAEIIELADLFKDLGTLLLQSFQGFRHVCPPLILAYSIRTDHWHKKRKQQIIV